AAGLEPAGSSLGGRGETTGSDQAPASGAEAPSGRSNAGKERTGRRRSGNGGSPLPRPENSGSDVAGTPGGAPDSLWRGGSSAGSARATCSRVSLPSCSSK